MSIVVTCSCTRTWRLPDRYAGKRCRCRECGEPIAVPRASAKAEKRDEPRGRKPRGREGDSKRAAKPRNKDAAARQTTRRLNSQDREIIGERRRIRSSERRVPVSESIHQLAPIALSGDRLDLSPAAPVSKKRAAASATATKAKPRTKARKPQAAPAPKARGAAVEAPANKKRGAKARAEKPRKRAERKAGKAAEPARGRRAPRGRTDDEEQPSGMNRRVAGVPLVALLGIAAVLCLGIGLAVGGLIGGKGGGAAAASPDLERRFATFEQLKAARKWADAKKELDLLAGQLATDEAGLARIKAARPGVDAMAQIAGIEDDEARLMTLVDNIGHKDAAIRLAIVTELRELSEHEPAQQALGKLATDADPRVADSAQQGLVAAGGKHSIPYLGKAIEQAAASGHKIGEIALSRALEIDDPAVVPVLLTALKARSGAPASVLRAVLRKLEEHGDAKCADAVKPFLSHKDAEVQAAARRVLDAIG